MKMGFNSRIYTNSFSGMERALLFHNSNNYGGSFGNLSKAQYAHLVYHELADNGAGFASRGARWARVNKYQISFIPPK
jgi:hypothetical protein